jgi:hypothetical protein
MGGMVCIVHLRPPSQVVVCSCATLRLVALLAIVTTFGCGGKTSGQRLGTGSSSGGGSSDAASQQDGGWGQPDGSGPWSQSCPESLPSLGGACTEDQLQCEYGDAWWNVSCDTTVQCIGERWSPDQPSNASCLPEPGANPTACPSNPEAIGQETPCPDAGLACVYGQGVFCSCEANEAETGVPGWNCLPEPGCPSSRPRLGAPCTTGMVCTYDPCVYDEECISGVWQGGAFIGCGGP